MKLETSKNHYKSGHNASNTTQKRNIKNVIDNEIQASAQTLSKPMRSILTILRCKQVEMRTGLSRSTIYARIAAGTFPAPIDLGGGRAVGWLETEIEAWLQSRIAASRKIT